VAFPAKSAMSCIRRLQPIEHTCVTVGGNRDCVRNILQNLDGFLIRPSKSGQVHSFGSPSMASMCAWPLGQAHVLRTNKKTLCVFFLVFYFGVSQQLHC
jgi:hypothetical protein